MLSKQAAIESTGEVTRDSDMQDTQGTLDYTRSAALETQAAQ